MKKNEKKNEKKKNLKTVLFSYYTFRESLNVILMY